MAKYFVTFDHNKRKFLTGVWLNGDGLWKTDNINQMIRLSVITLSVLHCTKNIFELCKKNLAYQH